MTQAAPRKKAYIETYGCQMNVSDSELMQGILAAQGYDAASNPEDADIILVNTCAIRDHAEQRVFGGLFSFQPGGRGHQPATQGL